MVDIFLNELTLAITVYFLRHIVSLISSSGELPNQFLSLCESFHNQSLSLWESFPNQSLSLWERSGEGFHIASHSSYAGGVPSPNLPHRGRDCKWGLSYRGCTPACSLQPFQGLLYKRCLQYRECSSACCLPLLRSSLAKLE